MFLLSSSSLVYFSWSKHSFFSSSEFSLLNYCSISFKAFFFCSNFDSHISFSYFTLSSYDICSSYISCLTFSKRNKIILWTYSVYFHKQPLCLHIDSAYHRFFFAKTQSTNNIKNLILTYRLLTQCLIPSKHQLVLLCFILQIIEFPPGSL